MFPERAQVRFKFLYKNLMLTGFFFFFGRCRFIPRVLSNQNETINHLGQD
jgi:hypothetical protein